MSKKTSIRKRTPGSLHPVCSADFAACRVAYELVAADGLPIPLAEADELTDHLFALKGKGWHSSELTGGVCGTFFAVEFNRVPSKADVESVRVRIAALLNSPQNK